MSGNQGSPKDKQIAKLTRREKIRDDMLRGLTNQNHLARRYGVTSATIHKDVKFILNQWREKDDNLAEAQKIMLLDRLEWVMKELSVAWERSKQNKEEISTQYIPRKCSECKGTGMLENDEWCPACDGEGKVIEEKVSRKQTGQAGDPRFMEIIRNLLMDEAKILGVTKDRGLNFGIQQNIEIGGRKIDPKKLSRDLIIEARKLADQIRTEGGKSITVEFEEANDDAEGEDE